MTKHFIQKLQPYMQEYPQFMFTDKNYKIKDKFCERYALCSVTVGRSATGS